MYLTDSFTVLSKLLLLLQYHFSIHLAFKEIYMNIKHFFMYGNQIFPYVWKSNMSLCMKIKYFLMYENQIFPYVWKSNILFHVVWFCHCFSRWGSNGRLTVVNWVPFEIKSLLCFVFLSFFIKMMLPYLTFTPKSDSRHYYILWLIFFLVKSFFLFFECTFSSTDWDQVTNTSNSTPTYEHCIFRVYTLQLQSPWHLNLFHLK